MLESCIETHYNPAVTISVYLRGSCDKDDVLYIFSQVSAAMIAALISEKLLTSEKDHSVELFSLSSEALIAEFLFTFLLAYVILNVATTESTSGNGYFGAAIALVLARRHHNENISLRPSILQ